MGLLEKAGEKKKEVKPKGKVKAVAKAKPKVAAKAKTEAAVIKKTPVKAKKERKTRERRVREPRVMPEDFTTAGRAARTARRLVDFIVNYSGIVALVAVTATGSFFDPTLFLIGALIPIVLNMVLMPIYFKRTVGMFLTRTRYVTSKGNYPNWTHLTFSNLTSLFLMGGVIGLFMGVGNGEKVALIVGIVLLLVVATDYVVTKLRYAAGQQQNLWDTMYGCWFVVAERIEGSDNKLISRLESLGDWGAKKGWSGSEEDDSEDSD